MENRNEYLDEITIQSSRFIAAWNDLAKVANNIAREKGFYSNLIALSNRRDISLEDYNWLQSTALQASICRMHSELSEAVEALRHDNPPDSHIPKYSGIEAELADVIIRILDTTAEHRLDVAGAILAKMKYNVKRPYKHGKNS